MPNVYIERTIESREVSTLDITQTRNGCSKNHRSFGKSSLGSCLKVTNLREVGYKKGPASSEI